jgi:hypothetical protein
MIPQPFLKPSWQSSSAFHALATARVTVAASGTLTSEKLDTDRRNKKGIVVACHILLLTCSSFAVLTGCTDQAERDQRTSQFWISRRPASIESRNRAFSMLALSNPLPLLGPHLGVFAGSTVGFTFLQWASATFSPRFFPVQFATFTARNKRGWDSHVVCSSLNVYESLR